MSNVITPEMIKGIGAAVGPGKFFFVIVREDGADHCDVAASCRSAEDAAEARRLLKLFSPITPRDEQNLGRS